MAKKKFVSYRDESRLNYGFHTENGDHLNLDQLNTGASLRIADQIEQLYRWGAHANLCGMVRAIPKIARALENGITIRHEHSLTLRLHWSIRWPWQQKYTRRQRTWRLFKRK